MYLKIDINFNQQLFSVTARVATFNITQIPAPPTPPETIANEQDRQAQVQYEQWLNHQHQVLTQQLKYYETEVQKLRKIRKVRIEYFSVAVFSVF